ncbi:MAG: ATP-dependent Clp protease adapter ClpS [Campylobacteraceae bacterium]|jgi:ATP-dependent Clp protease adaptor protein ClpS|nr:ATP-dependent Clp protease adapter ClpS [Campylobacteraceae bacterium]
MAETEHKTDTAQLVKNKLSMPKNYIVYLLNDDFTTMDFVIKVLMIYFGHDAKGAFDIMLKVHKEGKGVCGVYPFEIAQTKVEQVMVFARANDFPLRASMEEE